MTDQPTIDLLLRRAAAARDAGALADADALYQLVLDIDPAHDEAVRQRVAILNQLNRFDEAIAVLVAASREAQTNPAWPFGRGLIPASRQRHADAVAAFDAAIELTPRDPALHHARGVSLHADHRYDSAIAAYDEAITLEPANHDHYYRRAAARFAIGDFADSLRDCDAAIALRPDLPEPHIGRTAALRGMGRYDEALTAYDAAIAAREDFAEAWFGKAELLLAMRRFDEAWPLFEWRLYTSIFGANQRLFPRPFWDGTPLEGRTLLVHAEQGLGDSIQFYRFVAPARELGSVTVLMPEKLSRLFIAQPDAPPIASEMRELPPFDVHCSMLSLPYLLGHARNAIASEPHLRTEPALAATWAARLPVIPAPRIGIAWAGNPLHPNDRNRSMPLATMLSMFDPCLTIVSLQKDVPEADRATPRATPRILDFSEATTDFADTAAIISQLDLVISVDSSVAHLAGAMGKPVWLLLPFQADWRWMLNRDDSPWYRSARLFRQTAPGDWAGVVERVRQALLCWSS
jgi:tetratricopeptide (TPR) repeat protein